MSAYTEMLEAAWQPALDAYRAALRLHGRDWLKDGNVCLCGRPFRTPNGLGLHAAAADRKAGKICDAAMSAATAAITAEDRRRALGGLPDSFYVKAAGGA